MFTVRKKGQIGVGALAAAMVGTALSVVPTGQAQALAPPGESLRPVYHLTAPRDWLSDPQRPIWIDGQYHLYYLWGDRDTEGGEWRHATTTDNVVFQDQGVAIPKETDFPVWTGSAVIDTQNTAGFGEGAVVVLATQPTDGDRYQQEQYLYYSTDGGFTFSAYGDPVILNPDRGNNDWFRDPKIVWDDANDEWVAVIGMQQKVQFFTSDDLKDWTYQSEFAYTTPNIGGMECPDIFQIRADDGSWHWVLGTSMQGDYSGLPNTYSYWIGEWDGQQFTPDDPDPQWADWGMDWYAAVTWPDEDSPEDTRFAIAWMNNWEYADEDKEVPSSVSDDISGQMSVVRQMTLAAQSDGGYSLLSTPVDTLADHVTRELTVPTTVVDDEAVQLDYRGTAYEIETDISWDELENVGLSVGLSADGTRHTDLGVYGNETFYLNRGPSDQVGQDPDIAFAPWTESRSSFDSSARSVHLRIFVDKGSVEVFVDDGKDVHSSQVYFAAGDSGIQLYTDGGAATFSNFTIREYADITAAAEPGTVYQDFEAADYGSWTTTGEAFGTGPVSGALDGQAEVTGYQGEQFATSFHDGDSATGTLVSPDFTIEEPFVNLLVGGGELPAPGEVFADFEGSTWGEGWTDTGDFTGYGPTASDLEGQVGDQVLDTYVGDGDSATGTISSPTFTITRDRINLRIAGGNHPAGSDGETTVNLLIDGVVHRTATGDDSAVMREVSWDVRHLVGRTAQIQVVDQATGDWGHLMVDHIVLADQPGQTGDEEDAQTTVNLVVDGQTVRTATGAGVEHLSWRSWLVDDLVGQTARIEVVDTSTAEGGHLNLDHIVFGDRAAA